MDTGISRTHLARYVVRPALEAIDAWSPVAEDMVTATALYESKARYLKQIGGGPACGLWQIEPATGNDIRANWLLYRQTKRDQIRGLMTLENFEDQLVTNMMLGAALCRIQYLRSPIPLPTDPDEAGVLYKTAYNTALGAGSAADFARVYAGLSD